MARTFPKQSLFPELCTVTKNECARQDTGSQCAPDGVDFGDTRKANSVGEIDGGAKSVLCGRQATLKIRCDCRRHGIGRDEFRLPGFNGIDIAGIREGAGRPGYLVPIEGHRLGMRHERTEEENKQKPPSERHNKRATESQALNSSRRTAAVRPDETFVNPKWFGEPAVAAQRCDGFRPQPFPAQTRQRRSSWD